MCPQRHAVYCSNCYSKSIQFNLTSCPLCRNPFGISVPLFSGSGRGDAKTGKGSAVKSEADAEGGSGATHAIGTKEDESVSDDIREAAQESARMRALMQQQMQQQTVKVAAGEAAPKAVKQEITSLTHTLLAKRFDGDDLIKEVRKVAYTVVQAAAEGMYDQYPYLHGSLHTAENEFNVYVPVDVILHEVLDPRAVNIEEDIAFIVIGPPPKREYNATSPPVFSDSIQWIHIGFKQKEFMMTRLWTLSVATASQTDLAMGIPMKVSDHNATPRSNPENRAQAWMVNIKAPYMKWFEGHSHEGRHQSTWVDAPK
jgi:hypothetical protein